MADGAHPASPAASVVIPARDAAATLPATLSALANQVTDASFEVIVVDDGSADGTAVAAERAPLDVRVLRGPGEGPARARNRGVAEARGELLVFTDADCEPEPGWLQAVLDAAATADLVQGRVLPPEGARIGPYDRLIHVEAEYGLYETANLAVRRDLFDRLGGFQSILEPRRGKELGEDVWLGWRARRAGARTSFSAAAVVRHAVFPRGPAGYVGEQARARFFPELVRRVPELREAFLHRRVFLSQRTARFDLAVAGVGLAVGSRRPWPLLLGLPHLVRLRREARGWPEHPWPAVAGVRLAADVVTLLALLVGSARSRSVVL